MDEKPKPIIDPKTRKSRLSIERMERVQRIAGMYLRGVTIREIAELAHVSTGQVHRDLAHAKAIWKKTAEASFEDLLSKEFARLDAIEDEAWKAWRRSQQLKLERAKEVTQSTDGQSVKRTKRQRQSDGEAAFLQIALGCVDRRLKLIELAKKRNEGDGDDMVVKAVEVIVHTREQAQAMLEFEEFRSMVKDPNKKGNQT